MAAKKGAKKAKKGGKKTKTTKKAAGMSDDNGDRIVPAVNVLITFMRGRSTGNAWETHLNERFPLLNMSICPMPPFQHRTEDLPINGRGHRVRQAERVQHTGD